jgi:hypothetical protein
MSKGITRYASFASLLSKKFGQDFFPKSTECLAVPGTVVGADTES